MFFKFCDLLRISELYTIKIVFFIRANILISYCFNYFRLSAVWNAKWIRIINRESSFEYIWGSQPNCPKIFYTKKKNTLPFERTLWLKPYICPLCTYASYKMENMLLHSQKVHHLKGCKDYYFVNEDILKKQKTLVDIHIEIAKPMKK